MGSLSRLLETPVLRRLRPRPVGMPSEHSTEGRCAFSRKPRPPPPPPSWTAPVRQTVAWGPVAFSRSARSPPPPAVTWGHALGRLTRRHAPGRLTRGSLRVFAKTTPTATVFTVTAAPEFGRPPPPVPPRPIPTAAGGPRPQPGDGPLHLACFRGIRPRACSRALDPRVVARFRKKYVPPTCARPSPGRHTRPERGQRQVPAPAGGSLRDFAKITSPRPAPVLPRGGTPVRAEPNGRSLPRREGRCAISQKSRSPTCARPSPGRHTRPERHQRQEPAPAGGACPAGGRGRCAISQKIRPPRPVPVFPASWPGSGRTRREGRCGILQKSRPPRPVLVLPGVVARPARTRREGRCSISQKNTSAAANRPFPSRPAPKPAARSHWTAPRPTRNSAGAGAPREAPFCPSVRR